MWACPARIRSHLKKNIILNTHLFASCLNLFMEYFFANFTELLTIYRAEAFVARGILKLHFLAKPIFRVKEKSGGR